MVTPRALLITLLLLPFNAYWVIMMEITRFSGQPTTMTIGFNVVFVLAVLLVLNTLLGKFWPRARLSPGELLTVYILLALTTAIAGHDMIENLLPILPYAHYFARPENGWAHEILPYIPSWLCVSDPQALREFYLGTGTLYSAHNLRVWMTPVLWWTGFVTVLLFVMLCINTLLRRQWTESEKLSYPLVTLPLEMVNPRTQLFKARLFWLGAGLATVLEVWNGVAYLYPSIPMLPLTNSEPWQNLQSYFTVPPWNAIGWTPMALYPWAIALGMLLPVDLLFSAWFFAWVWRLESVLGAAAGYADIPGFPYSDSQCSGAYLGLAVFALWFSRSHFIRIWRGLFDRKIDLQDANEPLPYRVAVLGMVLGSIALFAFSRAAGMTPWMIAAYFLLYFAMAVAITRIRAEFGPPAHDLHLGGPDGILPSVMQSNTMARQDLTMFSMYFGFNRAYRSHPMPVQLEGFKIAESINGRYRPLFWAMLVTIVLGTLSAFWADLDQSYRYGAAEKIAPPDLQVAFGSIAWNRMHSWIKAPNPPQQLFNTRIALMVGFGIVLLLNILRLRLTWFPFHPVGFAISGSWSLSVLWLPMLIAWFIKMVLLRYGGLRAYRRALPFFLGVLLGECIVGSLWVLIGIALGIPTYAFWP
jgi:hypothetical protein